MNRFIVAAIVSLLPAASANAQSPVGEWLVKDGTAKIRIVPCGDTLWGVISWTKTPPGKDENNPNPALRNRSVMGMPILKHMKKSEGQEWSGEIYNAEDGKTYNGNIRLAGNDALEIQGCVLFGIVCGGEKWSRVPAQKNNSESAQQICARVTAEPSSGTESD